MYVSAPSMNHGFTLLQSDIDETSNCCEKNQLMINTSQAMLFGTRCVVKSTLFVLCHK